MLEWFSTNGNELVIALTSAIASGFVVWYVTPNPFRQRLVYRSKKARLQAKLAQHQADQKDPSSLLVEVILVIVFLTVLLLLTYPVAVVMVLVDNYLIDFLPESMSSPKPLVTLSVNTFSSVMLLTTFIPALKRLFYLKLPDFRTKQLQRRIERIEDDENLLS